MGEGGLLNTLSFFLLSLEFCHSHISVFIYQLLLGNYCECDIVGSSLLAPATNH